MHDTPDPGLHLYGSLIPSPWGYQLRLRHGVNFENGLRWIGEGSWGCQFCIFKMVCFQDLWNSGSKQLHSRGCTETPYRAPVYPSLLLILMHTDTENQSCSGEQSFPNCSAHGTYLGAYPQADSGWAMRCCISGKLPVISALLVHGPHLEERGYREPDSHSQEPCNGEEEPTFSCK